MHVLLLFLSLFLILLFPCLYQSYPFVSALSKPFLQTHELLLLMQTMVAMPLIPLAAEMYFNLVILVFLCSPLPAYVFTSAPQILHQFSQKCWKRGHFSLCTGSAKRRDVVTAFVDIRTSCRPVESQA